MDMIIRDAILSDAPVIAQLSTQLGYDISTEDTIGNMRLLSSSTDKIVVAVINDNVVGWMQLSCVIRLESQPFCEITGLIVDDNSRGRGIGKKLITYAIEWSKSKMCYKLRVRTNVLRLSTHEFYKSVGFTCSKEQKIFDMNM